MASLEGNPAVPQPSEHPPEQDIIKINSFLKEHPNATYAEVQKAMRDGELSGLSSEVTHDIFNFYILERDSFIDEGSLVLWNKERFEGYRGDTSPSSFSAELTKKGYIGSDAESMRAFIKTLVHNYFFTEVFEIFEKDILDFLKHADSFEHVINHGHFGEFGIPQDLSGALKEECVLLKKGVEEATDPRDAKEKISRSVFCSEEHKHLSGLCAFYRINFGDVVECLEDILQKELKEKKPQGGGNELGVHENTLGPRPEGFGEVMEIIRGKGGVRVHMSLDDESNFADGVIAGKSAGYKTISYRLGDQRNHSWDFTGGGREAMELEKVYLLKEEGTSMVRLGYRLEAGSIWKEHSGRGGQLLYLDIILPMSEASAIADFIRKDPKNIRHIVEGVMTGMVLRDESQWTRPQYVGGTEDALLRPPYEKIDQELGVTTELFIDPNIPVEAPSSPVAGKSEVPPHPEAERPLVEEDDSWVEAPPPLPANGDTEAGGASTPPVEPPTPEGEEPKESSTKPKEPEEGKNTENPFLDEKNGLTEEARELVEVFPEGEREKVEALLKTEVSDAGAFLNAWNSVPVNNYYDREEVLEKILAKRLPPTLEVDAGTITNKEYVGFSLPVGKTLVVIGDVEDHFGYESSGDLELRGNAGSGVSSLKKGGTTHVGGSVGFGVGNSQEGGETIVEGNARDGAGNFLLGGTVEIFGNVGEDACKEMTGGTFIAHGAVASFHPSAFSSGNEGSILFVDPKDTSDSKSPIPIFENGHFTPRGRELYLGGEIPGVEPSKDEAFQEFLRAQEESFEAAKSTILGDHTKGEEDNFFNRFKSNRISFLQEIFPDFFTDIEEDTLTKEQEEEIEPVDSEIWRLYNSFKQQIHEERERQADERLGNILGGNFWNTIQGSFVAGAFEEYLKIVGKAEEVIERAEPLELTRTTPHKGVKKLLQRLPPKGVAKRLVSKEKNHNAWREKKLKQVAKARALLARLDPKGKNTPLTLSEIEQLRSEINPPALGKTLSEVMYHAWWHAPKKGAFARCEAFVEKTKKINELEDFVQACSAGGALGLPPEIAGEILEKIAKATEGKTIQNGQDEAIFKRVANQVQGIFRSYQNQSTLRLGSEEARNARVKEAERVEAQLCTHIASLKTRNGTEYKNDVFKARIRNAQKLEEVYTICRGGDSVDARKIEAGEVFRAIQTGALYEMPDRLIAEALVQEVQKTLSSDESAPTSQREVAHRLCVLAPDYVARTMRDKRKVKMEARRRDRGEQRERARQADMFGEKRPETPQETYHTYLKELQEKRSVYLKAKRRTRKNATDEYLATLSKMQEKQRERGVSERGAESEVQERTRQKLYDAMFARRIQREVLILEREKAEGRNRFMKTLVRAGKLYARQNVATRIAIGAIAATVVAGGLAGLGGASFASAAAFGVLRGGVSGFRYLGMSQLFLHLGKQEWFRGYVTNPQRKAEERRAQARGEFLEMGDIREETEKLFKEALTTRKKEKWGGRRRKGVIIAAGFLTGLGGGMFLSGGAHAAVASVDEHTGFDIKGKIDEGSVVARSFVRGTGEYLGIVDKGREGVPPPHGEPATPPPPAIEKSAPVDRVETPTPAETPAPAPVAEVDPKVSKLLAEVEKMSGEVRRLEEDIALVDDGPSIKTRLEADLTQKRAQLVARKAELERLSPILVPPRPIPTPSTPTPRSAGATPPPSRPTAPRPSTPPSAPPASPPPAEPLPPSPEEIASARDLYARSRAHFLDPKDKYASRHAVATEKSGEKFHEMEGIEDTYTFAYEKGSSVERELQEMLGRHFTDLNKTERGKVAHLIRHELEKEHGTKAVRDMFGTSKKSVHRVATGKVVEVKIPHEIIERAVRAVRPSVAEGMRFEVRRGDTVGKIIDERIHKAIPEVTPAEHRAHVHDVTKRYAEFLARVKAKDGDVRAYVPSGDIDRIRPGEHIVIPKEVFDIKVPIKSISIKSTEVVSAPSETLARGVAQKSLFLGGEDISPQEGLTNSLTTELEIQKGLATMGGVERYCQWRAIENAQYPEDGTKIVTGKDLVPKGIGFDPERTKGIVHLSFPKEGDHSALIDAWGEGKGGLITLPGVENGFHRIQFSQNGMFAQETGVDGNTLGRMFVRTMWGGYMEVRGDQKFWLEVGNRLAPVLEEVDKENIVEAVRIFDNISNTPVVKEKLFFAVQKAMVLGYSGYIFNSDGKVIPERILEAEKVTVEVLGRLYKDGTLRSSADAGFDTKAVAREMLENFLRLENNLAVLGDPRFRSHDPIVNEVSATYNAGGVPPSNVIQAMFHVLRSQITRHEAVLKGTPPAPTPPLAEAVALGATAPATPSFVSTETTPVQPLTPTETTAPLTDPEQAFVNHFSSREAKEVAQTFIQTPFDPKKPKVFANAWVNVSQYPVGDTTSYFFTALTQKIPKNTTIVVNAGEFAGKESMGLGTPKGVSMIVEGNVGNNSGAVVRGFLEVRGNAGHQFGATATGDLLLRGNAESYAGNDLQEGAVLEVLGNVGREACPHMKGGTFIPHGSVASFAESAFFPDNKGTIYYHTAENPTTLISIFDNGHFTPEGADMARAGQIPGIPPEKAMELLEKAPAQPATKLNLSIDPEKTRGNNGRAVEEK